MCSAWQVREGFIEGERCYEIYVIVGPMEKDDIKCAPSLDLTTKTFVLDMERPP